VRYRRAAGFGFATERWLFYFSGAVRLHRVNTMSKRVIAVILMLLSHAHTAPAKTWRVREGCTLVENPANDGDSFHVRMGRRTYIFRLLWVDAPETDDRFPERVAEQSAYFGISTQAVFRAGREAQRFTREFLSRQPFTVYTQFADARGASEKNRYYAIIKSGDTFLMEALVANGLARIHGIQIMPPGAPSESVMRMRLRGLETEAKRQRRGAWGLSGPTLNRFERLNRPADVARQTIILSRHLPIYAADDPTRVLGALRPGTEITVLRAESITHVAIRFRLENGQSREALARRIDLGL
jgi:endonuclease YncB( thermonuclease family)